MATRFPILLNSESVDKILTGERRISLDLGLSTDEVRVEGDKAIIRGNEVCLEDLRLISKESESVFFIESGRIYKLAIADRHFYKLVPTDGAPTIEIDGIRMHRTSGVTPEIDAHAKISVLGIDGGRVLDTCTGLGYTAIDALERGSTEIITIEMEANVLRIAIKNPWSMELFESERIHKLIGDSYHLVDLFSDEFFDYIIHDPPRLGTAGNLYGKDFYASLYRVLRGGGRFFHYVGKPGYKYRKIKIKRGVMRRLRGVGFRGLRYHEDVRGITGTKI